MSNIFVEGWSMDDWKSFHDLKVKANAYNLEVGFKILRDELGVRAHREIQLAFESDGAFIDDEVIE